MVAYRRNDACEPFGCKNRHSFSPGQISYKQPNLFVLSYSIFHFLLFPLPHNCVGKAFVFSVCPSAAFVRSFVHLSVRAFVWTDLVTVISHEWLEQSL